MSIIASEKIRNHLSYLVNTINFGEKLVDDSVIHSRISCHRTSEVKFFITIFLNYQNKVKYLSPRLADGINFIENDYMKARVWSHSLLFLFSIGKQSTDIGL